MHAGPLGIYGNCVVVDHGYGLQSIYGHMRQIDVKEGDMVQKEQVIGRSGATGLAGGDHIHFSMQVDGVQVNPIEWWDEHWIKDRILSKLSGPAAPAAGSRTVKVLFRLSLIQLRFDIFVQETHGQSAAADSI